MKVILKQEVDNLGYAGDVVDVADGYGRNFLLPRGLAIKATRGAMKQAETLTRTRKAKEAETLDDAQALKAELEGRTLRIAARVDERGHLYGSVGAGEVHDVLRERGHEVERRRVDLRRSIKEIGTYTVPIHIHPQVTAEVEVEVVDVEGKVLPGGRTVAEEESLEERALAAAEAVEGEEAPEADAVVRATGEAEPEVGGSETGAVTAEDAAEDTDVAEPTEA